MEKKLANLSLGKEEDEGLKEVECGWDVSLRAQPRRASITLSVWLREDIWGEIVWKTLASKKRQDKEKEIQLLSKGEKEDMKEDSEELPLENKKRHRSNNQVQGASYVMVGCGDFNEILYFFEKERGLPRDESRMEEFRTTLNECRLENVGYVEELPTPLRDYDISINTNAKAYQYKQDQRLSKEENLAVNAYEEGEFLNNRLTLGVEITYLTMLDSLDGDNVQDQYVLDLPQKSELMIFTANLVEDCPKSKNLVRKSKDKRALSRDILNLNMLTKIEEIYIDRTYDHMASII
ncbi:hypothetical protein Goarm_005758 [Gossypium armourianum]|uniref:Uncharacterized protein n=1 Tax=Gossypium armourianum TaxID=34283 RepID=A0A7J9KG05_9ROSI|nr:hypothetical protein [Gossypium armourianum]